MNPTATDISKDEIANALDQDGYIILEGILSDEYVERARAELEVAIEKEASYHGGSDYPDYGMVLLCALYGGAFLDLFDNEALLEPFEVGLGEGCTVYAYTSSSMPPGKTNFSNRIHVDCPRLIPGYMTNMGATILLDDFTEENGATYFMPGSHEQAKPPDEAEYMENAKRVIAPAGSVFFFNARLWHSGGGNQTDDWRHALTINMCRPYMKQRIDIPRAMEGMDLSGVSDRVLQKLGFKAQVPASYDEYYVPAEQRKYTQAPE